jgi:hypothetical protein
MNTIALPLLLALVIVTPAVAHGQQATVTAPPGSKIGPITVTPLTYTHLNGTWNLVDSSNNTLGQITFGSVVVQNN